MEELYDHRNDPNGWDNIAYKEGYQAIIEEHRKVLLDMLPELAWREGPPDGYTVDSAGNVHSNSYESWY